MLPPMAKWLVKSEPSAWSWEDHWSKPDRIEPWNGVRNHQAASFMRAMKVGDQAFFYRSVEKPAVMGVLRVARAFHADPTDETGKFGMVAFEAVKPLARPVTLTEMRAEPALAHLHLFRQSRLSVMPVDDAAWRMILAMSKTPVG